MTENKTFTTEDQNTQTCLTCNRTKPIDGPWNVTVVCCSDCAAASKMTEDKAFGFTLHLWSKETGHKDVKKSATGLTVEDAFWKIRKHYESKGYTLNLKSWKQI